MNYKSPFFIILFFFCTYLSAQEKLISPHGDKMRLACETCHTASDWNKIPKWKFNHDRTGFALLAAHQNAECKDCHQSLVFNQVAISCIDCHTDIHKSELGTECENCHNSRSWENRSEISNQHSQTNFPLIGVHANLDCESCHLNEQTNQFTALSVECQSCHLGDFLKTINPSHKRADFDLDCQKCHLQVNANWQSASFEHPSTFVLKGAHKTVDCAGCHTTEFAGLSNECYFCHRSDFETASDPDHSAFSFPTVCEKCHTEISWDRADFDHFSESGFMLEGAHQSILCTDCHHNNQVSGLPRDCFGCHQNDFNLASDPGHVQNNFSENCLDCHNVNAWEPATFDHQNTEFQLSGAHASVACSDCHINNYNEQLPLDCFSCHQADFTSTRDPNHVTNNFDHDCLLCHTVTVWEPAIFDHSATQFPLSGAHNNVNCADCHTTGYTQQLPTDCYSCHQTDFISVSDPSHVTNNFDHDCLQCHTVMAWEPAIFDHSATEFPLSGAHNNVNCADCHTTGYTQQLPTDCFSCHEKDFNGVSDPNHISNNFDHDCMICHSTTAWTPANFDHTGTEFPLTGAHININCADCHTTGYTQQLPIDCFSCHELDFTSVDEPNHVTNNFDHDCLQCHTVTAWEPATFDHSGTEFPLAGAHININCADCHTTGYTQQLPIDCFSCHELDFTATNDPGHVANNFDHDCLICHTTVAWQPATFDHTGTEFPLTGAHNNVNCADCHTTGYTQQLPIDCYSCHETDYNNVSDPNHISNNFDHDCLICHSTTAWTPATFNHANTQFPLAGAHINTDCLLCHGSGYQNTPLECVACHQTDYDETTNPNHQSVQFPTTCETCHTTVAWDPSTWDHDGQYFPIYSGAHREKWDDCTECHNNPANFVQFECINCHEHNQQEMDDKHKEESDYEYNSIRCFDCHPNGKS